MKLIIILLSILLSSTTVNAAIIKEMSEAVPNNFTLSDLEAKRIKLKEYSLVPLKEDEKVPGDANSDKIVNFTDFVILSNSLGTPNLNADFNEDYLVDMNDFYILQEYYGTDHSEPPIPEPNVLMALLLSSLLLLKRKA